MFISTKEMQWGKVRFRETLAPGVIEFLDRQLWQAAPLEAEGVAELSSSTMGIRVAGHLKVLMEAECDRCLEAVVFPLDTNFELSYMPDAPRFPDEEIKIEERDTDIGFYTGDGLELADILREQILLSLPMQRVCREDCQGICPVCGANRNQSACGCHEEIQDDRWSKLRNL
jgi:uncharacterized protein